MNPSLLVCLLSFGLFGMPATAQGVAAFNLVSLGHGEWAAIDNPAAKEAESGSNGGFFIGAEGVVVVDTFENVVAAQKLLALIREKTKLPIRFVVNTHYHLDHVAGNNVFTAAGATTLAQENVRRWERSQNLKFFGEKITPQQRSLVETLGLPEVTYVDGATVYVGGTSHLELRVMPGHTGGDTVVYDPEANVVYCGDLFWNRTLPNLIDATTKDWIDTLERLVVDYPSAAFVPGHGDEVGHAAEVTAFREYLVFLRSAVTRAQAEGKRGDALLQAVLPEVKARYGTWGFPEFAEPDIQRTDEELRGVKQIPRANQP